jgi:4-diphosphocytidyl-2-C-methyl-D-erythritol kinase
MSVQVLTPAKLNLGLEVIRKRPDGFHELATVFQTISVFDHLTLAESQYDEVEIVNRIDQIESNLVQRALSVAREREITDRHWRVEVKKRIPIAAGLGGASADAAAALLALAKSSNVSVNDVAGVALELGSDVPFLLFGGAALAHGRGEVLTRLPSLRNCWLVLATPAIEIERKTAALRGVAR